MPTKCKRGMVGALAASAVMAWPAVCHAQQNATEEVGAPEMLPPPAETQTPPPDCAGRSFSSVRSDESPSAWADHDCDRDWFDGLRSMDMGRAGVLSVGGEVRVRYELDSTANFDRETGDGDGAFFGRAYLFADWRAGERVRTFVNLRATEAVDRDPFSRIVDDAGLDLQEAFVELWATDTLSARFGRQEFSLPTDAPSRLLSTRNGPNVRRTFDGAHLLWKPDALRLDGFYLETVDPERGTFNDRASGTERIWGARVSTAPQNDRLGWDGYYYGFADEEAEFQPVSGDQTRHTLGTRVVRQKGMDRWDLDAEAAFQWGDITPPDQTPPDPAGRHNSRDIRAGFAAVDAGYTFEARFRPRLGIQAYVSSGDDADGDTVGTFDAIYPSGAYLNDATLLRGQNVTSLGIRSDARLSDSVSGSIFYTRYWRTSGDDGFYLQNARLAREGMPDQSRFIGDYAGLRTQAFLNHRTDALLQFGVFDAGRFLQQSGAADTHIFLRIDLRVRV